MSLPRSGTAFISVRDPDKHDAVALGQQLHASGFTIIATSGTAAAMRDAGVECEPVLKVNEGRPHILDHIKNDTVDLIINTTEGAQAIADSYELRRAALHCRVPYTTTIAGATAVVMAISGLPDESVRSLQSLHEDQNR